MNSLKECVNQYIKEGYNRNYAISKVCQDIIINRIYHSKYSDKITIKGGVVMFHLTNNIRRATVDIDMDLINMSIRAENIVNIFIELSKLDDIDSFKLSIDKNKIEKLSHQDYHGKRLTVSITDNYRKTYNVKLDIGVHKYFDMKQDEYYFDFNIIDESVSLLINSKEQIIVEKLKSLLKFGITSTRFKDVFDFYYLINNENLDKDKLIKYIDILIFQDENMRENELKDIHIRLTNILNNNRFQSRINTTNNNWLEIPIKDVINSVLDYFDNLIKVTY